MKLSFLIVFFCLSFSALAARKSLEVTGLKAHDLCARLGNYSGFGTRDGAFGITCEGNEESARATIIFDSDRNSALTQVSINSKLARAVLTDKKEAYDMLNSVGRSFGGPGYYITCRALDEYTQFAESCTIKALVD